MQNKSMAFSSDDKYLLHFFLGREGFVEAKGIVETKDLLSISFDEVDGTYMVVNLDGPKDWVGIDTDKNRAIIKYLCTRLSIKFEDKAE